MVKLISRRKAVKMVALSPFVLGNCAHFMTKPQKTPSSKKIDVPAVWGFDLMGCSSYVIKGISDYYGLNKSISEINKDLKKGFWKPSYITNNAALLSGYGLTVDFYYLYNDVSQCITYDDMIPIEKLPEKGVKIHNKHLPLEEIISAIDKSNPSVVYVDYRTIKGIPKENSYIGHVVAAKGYDNNYLYLNDTSKVFGERKVKKDIFERARRCIPLECSITLSKS